MRSFFLLSAAALVSAAFVPEGKYCGAKTVLGLHEAKITFEVDKEAIHLRIDGDMHWSWCSVKMTELDDKGAFSLKRPGYDTCYTRLLQEKSGDVEPNLSFDVKTGVLTIEAKNVLPAVASAVIESVTVELTAEGCDEHGSQVFREWRDHDEL